MTAKELIKLLQEVPEDMPIMVQGYEGGFNKPSSVYEEEVILMTERAWYYGQYEDTNGMDYKDAANTVGKPFKALILTR